MTNAMIFINDLDRLTDAIYKTDEYDEACSMTCDETGELVGCRHDGLEQGCKICIKQWLQEEAKN